MTPIYPIKIICEEKYTEILLSDLKKLFQLVTFGEDSYNITHFEYKIPDNEELKHLKNRYHINMVAFTDWSVDESKQNLYFTEDYFLINNEIARISYFFHEICHYHTYSFVTDCNKINKEKIKIRAEKNKKVNQSLVYYPDKFSYLLSIYNEILADEVMISIKSDLYLTKLNFNRKYAEDGIESLHYFWDKFILLLDILRNIELLKKMETHQSEIKKLLIVTEKIYSILQEDSLEFKERVNVLMEYKDKFIENYFLKDVNAVIKLFYEFIDAFIHA